MGEHVECPECGTGMVRSVEDYHYKECGLENVMLRDVQIARCPDCNYTWVDVGDLQELHKGIAQRLIDQNARLDANEVRFICDYAVSRLDGWRYNEVGDA